MDHQPATNLPPAVSNASLSAGGFAMSAGRVELTLTRAPATVGRVAIANKDAILVQAASIDLFVRDLIDREKAARSNSGSLPELEALLAQVQDLRAKLITATSELDVGAVALLIKKGWLDWWDKDHISILSLGYKSGLFVLLMGLIEHFGLIPATIAATLLSKDVSEGLKQLAKLLQAGGSGDQDAA
jgi:hypothetical protein